jgi:hypothetical protein
MQWIPLLPKGGGLIQVDIGGHPPIPTGSFCRFLVQHVLLYFFVIMGSTLLGLSGSLHIFQVDIGGLPPNPTVLFCMYFMSAHLVVLLGPFWGPKQCYFGVPQSNCRQSQSLMVIMRSSLKDLSNGLSRA